LSPRSAGQFEGWSCNPPPEGLPPSLMQQGSIHSVILQPLFCAVMAHFGEPQHSDENLRSKHCRIFTYGGDFYLLENKWSGREDSNLPTPWSRTRCQTVLKFIEICCS